MGRPSTPHVKAPTSEELCADGALDIDGLAAFASLSRREVEKALAAGEVETFRRGVRVLIARREAVRWLAGMLDADRARRGQLRGAK